MKSYLNSVDTNLCFPVMEAKHINIIANTLKLTKINYPKNTKMPNNNTVSIFACSLRVRKLVQFRHNSRSACGSYLASTEVFTKFVKENPINRFST